MITAIMSVLGWVVTHTYQIIKWFGPALARILSNWWVLAGLSLFAISSWAFGNWDTICNGVVSYINSVTDLMQALNFRTNVAWVDAFMGYLALDAFAGYLVGFLAFFLPLIATVVIGIFVTMMGFAFKLIIYKITTSATRDMAR